MNTVLEELKSAVLETGTFVRNEFSKFDFEKVEYKGLNDLVSYVDKETEKLLVAKLQEILPKAGFLAEENASLRKDEHMNWVIDPLDGTTNFTHGLPIFAISVGLVDNGVVEMGVVYDVTRDHLYYAAKGEGAYCNEQPISVSSRKTLSESLLATGFPYYEFEKIDNYLSIVKSFMQGTHGLRRMGSAAIDMCYVASGKFEAFFEYNLKPWDIAAGIVIVEEAGGQVSHFDNGKHDLSGIETVASNRTIHNEMVAVIMKYW